MRISDWSSDVCSSDLASALRAAATRQAIRAQSLAALPDRRNAVGQRTHLRHIASPHRRALEPDILGMPVEFAERPGGPFDRFHALLTSRQRKRVSLLRQSVGRGSGHRRDTLAALHARSEEHTSELQSLMRLSYAVFGLKK